MNKEKIKPAKMTLYFYKVTGTASGWEKKFYALYEKSDHENKFILSQAYPELCLAWDEWFLDGDEYFKEFR